MISRHQIVAARALLDWTQDRLANAAGLTKDMISKIEGGKSAGSLKSLQSIEHALQIAGIKFGDNDGVSRSTSRIQVLEGIKGCMSFYDDVFETARDEGMRTICVNNVDERDFVKWQGEQLREHTERMKALSVQYKILIKQGDTFFPASAYAEYRWLPESLFGSVPFYIYGTKLAMLVFSADKLKIYILDEPEITKMHRRQFDAYWETALVPAGGDNA